MDNLFWKWVRRIAIVVGMVAGIVTTVANWQVLSGIGRYCLIGTCGVIGLIGLLLDFKLWRWSAFHRQKSSGAGLSAKAATIVKWVDDNDPALNQVLPSSRRTSEARKPIYLEARKMAIEAGLTPPFPTNDVERDLLNLSEYLSGVAQVTGSNV